jgi:dTMP kinase
MENFGKLIVIDGSDGSGKTTQLQLLKKKLEKDGLSVVEFDFPQYNTKSAGPVEEYLSGKYGDSSEVTPYQSSILYAVDRFDASFEIKRLLKQGKIVLSNRYVSSNLGHQGGKIDDALERKLFFNWLYELEYNIFNLPTPDLSIILYAQPEIAQKLAQNRHREDWKGKTNDIHENNLEHLTKAANVYLEIADSFPNFHLIRCSREEKMLSKEDIHYLVCSKVDKLFQVPEKVKEVNKSFQSVGQVLLNNQELKNYTSKIINFTNKKEEVPITNLNQSLLVERVQVDAKLPSKANSSDAGFDLFANEDYSIEIYGQALIKTGIKIAIPEGHVGLIWDKSGLANLGYTTLGGVIDESYRGEIKVIFKNLSEDIVHIKKGQKIAQLLIQKISHPEIIESKLDKNTERSDKGFGSSGLF